MISYTDELYHHGIKGQKWGVRRYQNEDGSLTAAGQNRYSKVERKFGRQLARSEKEDARIMAARSKHRAKISAKYDKKIDKLSRDIKSYDPIKNGLQDKKGRQILTADDVKNMVSSLQSKIDKLSGKRDAKLQDFDEGTKYIKAGQDAYNDVIRKYQDITLKSLSVGSTINPLEYASAKADYEAQRRSDNLYGTSYTKLVYAQASARNNRRG